MPHKNHQSGWVPFIGNIPSPLYHQLLKTSLHTKNLWTHLNTKLLWTFNAFWSPVFIVLLHLKTVELKRSALRPEVLCTTCFYHLCITVLFVPHWICLHAKFVPSSPYSPTVLQSVLCDYWLVEGPSGLLLNAMNSIDNNTRQPYLYSGGDYRNNYVEQLTEI